MITDYILLKKKKIKKYNHTEAINLVISGHRLCNHCRKILNSQWFPAQDVSFETFEQPGIQSQTGILVNVTATTSSL